MKMEDGLRIYNLFPRVAGKITNWKNHLQNIKDMDFNVIYINPIFETGYSNSLYAPKNFYKIDRSFIDSFSDLSPEEQLKEFLNEAHNYGLFVIIEIILTHTAMDSELLIEHPEWYKYENGDLKRFAVQDKGRWVEWGDLVEFDNENSVEKEELWEYWKNLLRYYTDLGFDGFKCEAAYKVPVELWKELITCCREHEDYHFFIADNLGASFIEMVELAQSGFDYLFTSIMWWDFSSQWLIEQHYKLKDIVKLISFPENYGEERIASVNNRDMKVSKARYALFSIFNSGIMIPIGYEYGCTTKLDVINSFEEDLDERTEDIRTYITSMNRIKNDYKIFNEETDIYLFESKKYYIFIIKKVSRDKSEEALIIVNMNYELNENIQLENLRSIIEKKYIKDISPENRQEYIDNNYHYILKPGEVRILYGKD